MNSTRAAIRRHQSKLRQCRKCPDMFGPVVVGQPVISPVMLIGQAPGSKEIEVGRPFAWTAGKTLFKWFAQIGLNETQFRDKVYMAAVCRCFPGKNPKGGDRVPHQTEIEHCATWLHAELKLLQPKLLLPVGKLAISQFLTVKKLNDIIGQQHSREILGFETDVIPLPHPSGASVWHRIEPGKTLLQQALHTIEQHPAWKTVCGK
ncbi:MAG: uracil-DNA glycosylase [Gammaproteobacteria bacterium]|jgi:uracil-DNA glycosylase|nr:uracil-DNA glycosylase [Gammaproteobacteria bacterium]